MGAGSSIGELLSVVGDSLEQARIRQIEQLTINLRMRYLPSMSLAITSFIISELPA